MSTRETPAASEKSPLAGVLSQLKALSGHGGAVVGDAYAQAARAVLNRVEQLEDLNAERRYEARVAAARAARDKSDADRRSTPSLPPPK